MGAGKRRREETGPYEVVTGWPHPLGHPGWTWGSQGGVFAENPDRIILLQRGELPVPEKAPEGYTGGYGAFGIPATQGKPRLENCILICRCGRQVDRGLDAVGSFVCRRARAAQGARSAPTIRKSTSGSWTTGAAGFRIHARRQAAGVDAGRAAFGARTTSTFAAPRTSRGFPTARSSSATDT